MMMMNFSRAGVGWGALLTLAILFLVSTAPAASAEAPADSGVPDEQGWITFDNARGWIEFTVLINDVPVRAMLDSGADGNAVSRQLVERAGIDLNLADEVRVQGIYGQEIVPTTREFELRFGHATVPIRGATVLPMPSPDLILGVGLFQASVVQIDYPNRRIQIGIRTALWPRDCSHTWRDGTAHAVAGSDSRRWPVSGQRCPDRLSQQAHPLLESRCGAFRRQCPGADRTRPLTPGGG